MILLDTNYLIHGLVANTAEAGKINSWLEQGEPICIAAIAWYEFLCGPLSADEITLATAILTAGVIPFTDDEAIKSAQLFNAVNRSRRFRVDAMIAATAITTGSSLATRNHDDFTPFTAHGLHLA